MNAHEPPPGAAERRARLLIQAALAAIIIATLVHTRADPDLWGHVLFGGDIVAARSIPAADPYSFASDIPWVNHEWLAEVAMYAAYAALGGPGLIALKVALVVLALLLAGRTLQQEGVGPPARELLLAIAAVGSIQQANAMRPQIFSILLFAATLSAMVRVERGRTAAIWWMPLVMFVWVNAHGGWVVGGGVLALWATARLFRPGTRETRLAFAVAAASAAATLVNPYGWGMWEFLGATIRPERFEISDWQPVYRMGPGILLTWLALVALAAAATWRASVRPPLARTLVILVLAAGAFQVNRLLMFLAIAVALLLAPQLHELLQLRRRGRGADAAPTRARPSRVPHVVASAVALAVIAGAVGAAATFGRCIIVESERWPEPEALGFIREHAPSGRMLSWFNWGEYAIWHLSPGIKVSMDGRRETVYSPQVLSDHLAFYFSGTNAREFLDALDADYVWIPSWLPVVPLLERELHLPVLWRGPQSVLFATRGGAISGRPRTTAGVPQVSRCFPGP